MVEHFADGEPSGIIREETYRYYVDSKIPIPSFDDAVDDIDKYLILCFGWTYHNAYQCNK